MWLAHSRTNQWRENQCNNAVLALSVVFVNPFIYSRLLPHLKQSQFAATEGLLTRFSAFIMNSYAKLITRLQPNGRRLLQQQQQQASAPLPVVRSTDVRRCRGNPTVLLGRFFQTRSQQWSNVGIRCSQCLQITYAWTRSKHACLVQ